MITTGWSRTLSIGAAFVLTALPASLFAQASEVLTSGPASMAPRTAGATAVEVGPTIDGVLDDAAWESATPLSGWVQYEPLEGSPATEDTEVRIIFDADAIYVGAWLRDSEPARIIPGERRRDSMNSSDGFLIVFDTYDDGQSGFVFGTTPGGIQYDGQVRGQGANTDWDGSWTVAATTDAQGWYAEMRIPFSTIRYGAGADQSWGMNATRYIGRKNEQDVWSPVLRQFGFYRLTEAGTLDGMQPPPRRVTTVTPYVLSSAQRIPRINEDAGEPLDHIEYPFEWGADAKVGITPSLALDLTYNTDFAQVEVDDQQVDLTRFSLFFPEKRPFFLENADLFQVGINSFPARTAGRTALFHSRMIGVADGANVPIDFGARLSGRAMGTDVGLLYMQTDELTGVQDPNGWAVARLAYELPNRSRVGAIFTSRSNTEDSDDYARTYGVDARLGIGDEWTFTTVAGLTEAPGVDDHNEVLSFVGEYLTRDWYIRGYFDQLATNFNPQVGFIPHEAFRESNLRIERIWRPAAEAIRELRVHTRRTRAHTQCPSVRCEEDHDGAYDVEELDIFHLHMNLDWESGANFSPAINWVEERLTEPFRVRGTDIVVPPAKYEGVTSYATWRTNPAATFSLNGRYDVGRFLSGNRYGGNLGLSWRQGATLTAGINVSHNRIYLDEGDYTTTLTRVNARYAFTENVFLQGLVQYSDQSRQWSGNVRFGWLDTAGTGLFLVYNERQTLDLKGIGGIIPRDAPDDTIERTFVVKFTRQFDVSRMTDF
jgi:hypothetical protein